MNRVRYNAVDPRLAYDQYREGLAVLAKIGGWHYLDLWNAVPPELFADPALHLALEGQHLFVQEPGTVVQSIACHPKP